MKQLLSLLSSLTMQIKLSDKRSDPIWQFVKTEYRDDPHFHYMRITGKAYLK
tara:strand:+ start:238 stop:393 length:156 start_codon:yes stop_codon:yes gene_type:complete